MSATAAMMVRESILKFIGLSLGIRVSRLSIGKVGWISQGLLGALHFYFLCIRERLAAGGPLFGLPRDRVCIPGRNDVGRGDLAAVCQGRVGLDSPFCALLCPHRFAEAAVGLKGPRSNLLGDRIPANYLHAVVERCILVF